VRYRVRTVEIRAPEPMSVAVGATYDFTITDTYNLHRGHHHLSVRDRAAAVAGWLLAAFAVQPLKRLAQQTGAIDVGGEAPDVDVRGAIEASRSPTPVNGLVQRIWRSRTTPRPRSRRPATSPR